MLCFKMAGDPVLGKQSVPEYLDSIQEDEWKRNSKRGEEGF